jgi:uncharacterized UPF0160 family protein
MGSILEFKKGETNRVPVVGELTKWRGLKNKQLTAHCGVLSAVYFFIITS